MNNRDYKQFVQGITYHIYNRGVGKMNISLDSEDYLFFLKRMKEALYPTNPTRMPLVSVFCILFLIFPSLIFGSSVGVSNFPSKLQSGLVGRWTFDGKDVINGVALDKSGNNNNGNLMNIATSTFYTSGKIGQAFNFDGVNDYVSINGPATSLQVVGDITISSWVKTSYNGDYQVVVDDLGSSPFTSWAQWINTSGKVVWYSFGIWKQSNLAVNDGKWHHIVSRVSSNNLSFYIDGVLDQNSYSSISTIEATSDNKAIGRRSDTNSYRFKGQIDDVCIYNRALSPNEIRQLYNFGNSKIGVDTKIANSIDNSLVGNWTFDGKDVVNGVALDKSGNNNNGNLMNIATSTFYTSGKIGQAFNFDGVNDYVNAGSSSSLDLSHTGTISFWMKYDGGGGAVFRQILGKGNSTSSSGGAYGFYYYNGYLYLNLSKISGGMNEGSITMPTGGWNHIVGVFDGSNLYIYKNGIGTLVASQTIDAEPTGDNFIIGTTHSGGTNFFKGKIDNIRVYNRALTANEIRQLYSSGIEKNAVPFAPTNISQGGTTRTSIGLGWRDNSNNESGFKVYYSATGPNGPWTLVTTTAPNVRNATKTGLTRNTQYWFYVVSFNVYGVSENGKRGLNVLSAFTSN